MRGSATGDAYVRLAQLAAHSQVYGTPDRSDALLFVDLHCSFRDAQVSLSRIRELPYGHFLGVRNIIVRAPLPSLHDTDDTDEPATLLDELDTIVPHIAPGVRDWAILEHQFGANPVLHWKSTQAAAPTDANRDVELLQRARAAELSALLESNHAVWAPTDYHFRLPSGSHTPSFVRVADGIASPRDAEVLATWLLPDLAPSVGMIFDNRSLTPLALAAERLFDRYEKIPGPQAFLEQYSTTQTDVERAVRHAASAGVGVLAVLSVSSAGTTRDRMIAALVRAGQPKWRLHVLLDRNVPADAPMSAEQSAEVSTWLGYGRGDDVPGPAGDCAQCVGQQGQRIVSIDPRFFDGMILPDPTLRMLTPRWATAAAPLWEACDSAGAVALEHAPLDEGKARRSGLEDKTGTMGVFVSVDRLLAGPDFLQKLGTGLKEMVGRSAEPGAPIRPAEGLAGVDVIVIASNDVLPARETAFRAALQALIDGLPDSPGDVTVVDVDPKADPEAWSDTAKGAIITAHHVLIVGASTVTGYTLQRLLVGCQEHLRAASSPEQLSGLVIHNRTATRREWATLRNSYGTRLYAIFDTVLPTESPLRSEALTIGAARAALSEVDQSWLEPLQNFFGSRSDLANGHTVAISATQPAPYVPLLWGLPAVDQDRCHIRQHSLFGHKLGPAAFMAAVGGAVHRERERIADEPGPVWHLFEMPALLRSYYDPLLVAAMLRWIRASEMWWGDQPEIAVVGLLQRATVEDNSVLIPELLLAAAQGKLPLAAAKEVEAAAVRLLDDFPESYGAGEAVALGAGLLVWRFEQGTRLSRMAALTPLPSWPVSEPPAVATPTA